MSAWLESLAAAHARGDAAVVVTVASAKGSAPREPGAKMVVGAGTAHGTIGGGRLELAAIGIARDALAAGAATELRRFPLGASLGQCCGGIVTLLFDPVPPGADWLRALERAREASDDAVVVTPTSAPAGAPRLVVTAGSASGSLGCDSADRDAIPRARRLLAGREGPALAAVPGPAGPMECLFDPVRAEDFEVVLFGAGHVGRALAAVLAGVDCRLAWVDARADAFPPQIPANARAIVSEHPADEVDAAPAGACFLVMTHDHALDEEIAARILARGDHRFFGLIGSATKRRRFEHRLRLRGASDAAIATMICPIGAPGIAGKEPATIAIAVAAQLLQVREAGAAAARDLRARSA